MKENVVEEKSFRFAVRVANLYRMLTEVKKEYILSKQLLRSGTSIGANISEAQHGFSKKDFISKMTIALKETYETSYWLRLLKEIYFLNDNEFESIYNDCDEILKLLVSIVKTSRKTISKT